MPVVGKVMTAKRTNRNCQSVRQNYNGNASLPLLPQYSDIIRWYLKRYYKNDPKQSRVYSVHQRGRWSSPNPCHMRLKPNHK